MVKLNFASDAKINFREKKYISHLIFTYDRKTYIHIQTDIKLQVTRDSRSMFFQIMLWHHLWIILFRCGLQHLQACVRNVRLALT